MHVHVTAFVNMTFVLFSLAKGNQADNKESRQREGTFPKWSSLQIETKSQPRIDPKPSE